jgi:hypothetical protein
VSEVGFEKFRITSDWGDPNGVFGQQTFVHHLSGLMDYGWQALFIQVCTCAESAAPQRCVRYGSLIIQL